MSLASNKLKRAMSAFILLAATTACGVKAQQTPEPKDAERVGDLVRKLGIERTYNGRSLVINPDPDGLVFQRWVDRRASTQARGLPLNMLPAAENPGSIANTLKWERATEKAEGGAQQHEWDRYAFDMEARRSSCPESSVNERSWLTQKTADHATDRSGILQDFTVLNATWRRACDAEVAQRAAKSQAEKDSLEASRSQFIHARSDCKKISAGAEAAYADRPSVETGKAASAASHQVGICEAGVDERWHRVNPTGTL